MRILKSVHHSKRWDRAVVVGFAGSELCNIIETQETRVPIRGKILIQDLEKSAHRRCTNWSKSPAVSNFPERKGPPMSNFQGAVWAAVHSVMSARGTSCTRPGGATAGSNPAPSCEFIEVKFRKSNFLKRCRSSYASGH